MMMTVRRLKIGDDSMLGDLYVGGKWECHTLEDEPREVKVKGETAIPAGTYKVIPRTVGGTHERYKKRFPTMHQGMAWLQDVPNFEYILIHIGNTDEDTAGCLLVGQGFIKMLDGNYKITGSTAAYKALYPKITAAWNDGDEVWITYKDPE